MMNWKVQLEIFFNTENWHSAVELMQSVIKEYPNDVDAYVQMIYLLHYIVLEAQYPDHNKDHDHYASLLKQYFDDAEQKFSDNAEYLFFIGKILHIAEWYFGVDDDSKAMPQRKAFKMQKKASDIYPNNDLFRWSWMFSLQDEKSQKLAQKILDDDEQIHWLKSKGIAGNYIYDTYFN